MTVMYAVKDAHQRYFVKDREIRALNGLPLDVARGEFVAVVGASGSGKSTLLMLLGGLARPTAGQVLVDGTDLYAMGPRERAAFRARRIGFVFQTFQLIPYLSTLDNVLVPLLAGGGGQASDVRARAEELLAAFGVANRAAHRPSELSVGERQRVAMARALLRSPDILLADEPTGNLDPGTAAQLLSHLAAFHRNGGTVVLVTHDARLAASATRTVRLEAGRIVS